MEKEPLSVRTIFEEAIEIDSPHERTAYLDQACAGAPELRPRVEALLKAHQDAGNFLEQPATALDSTVDVSPIAEGPGTIIGCYKLLEEIGDGGMGVVYMAEQREPVRRKVALKIIKLGMDTRAVVARFEAERQALALMDHPNIAQALEAGVTGSGRPYFVMELVNGAPLTDCCDQNRLTAGERLELFVQVCRAVEHAHQKGIIHRDLKPSNVMVTLYDGVPVPKVIDFGVAKSVLGQLTEKTLFTRHGQIIGTPLYMSPEQAEMSGLDVDTRSDIYSLGVMLYELLTGGTPLHRERVREVAYDEFRRMIREEDPPRPSARISTLEAAAATTIAGQRKTDPARLSHLLRHDLDWIVMKALQKDRTRRYQTASDFARDIERYLHDEPVEARPPSLADRAAKWARRHRPLVWSAVILLLMAAVGLAATTAVVWQAQRRTAAALVDSDNARKDTEHALADAKRSEGDTNAVVDFLIDMLNSVTPEKARGRIVTVEEALAGAEKRIDGVFAGQPLVEARVRKVIGEVRTALGQYDRAERHLCRARDLFTEHLGPQHRQTLLAGNSLAGAMLGASKFGESQKLIEEVLAAQLHTLGANDPDTAVSMTTRGTILLKQGKFEDARKVLEEALATDRLVFGEAHRNTLRTMSNLISALNGLMKLNDASNLIEELLATQRRVLGADHPDTVSSMNSFAVTRLYQGKTEDARKLFEEAIASSVRVFGANDPRTLRTKNNVGNVLKQQGKLAEARRLFERNLAAYRQASVPSHPDDIGCMICLGLVLEQQGEMAKARRLYEEAMELSRRVMGADNEKTIYAAYWLIHLLGRHGKLDEACQIARENLAACRHVPNADHAATLDAASMLANVLAKQGKLDEAYQLAAETTAVCRRDLGADHPATMNAAAILADVLLKQGNLDEACQLARKNLAESRRVRGTDQPDTAMAMNALGEVLCEQGKFEEACTLFEEASAISRRVYGETSWDTYAGATNLAYVLGRLEKSEAGSFYENLLATQRRVPGTDNLDTLKTMNYFGGWLFVQGRLEDARKLYDEAVTTSARLLGANHPQTLEAAIRLGIVLNRLGKPAEARAIHERALGVLRQSLGANHPDTICCMAALAADFEKQGKVDEAITLLDECLSASRRLPGDRHPKTVFMMNEVAWMLSNAPGANELIRKRAVELARKATELAPKDDKSQRTLGVALYRTGDWKGAVTALEKSMQLRSGGDASDWFFLAMAHWQLGDKDEAQTEFDKAAKWMEKNVPKDEDLLRFRAEAAELLGIQEKAAPAKDEKPGKPSKAEASKEEKPVKP